VAGAFSDLATCVLPCTVFTAHCFEALACQLAAAGPGHQHRDP